MKKIRLLSTGQIFEADIQVDIEKELKPGQEMLVELEGIIEPAVFCSSGCTREGEKKEIQFVRLFSEEDQLKKKELKQKVDSFIDEAKKKTFRHGLDMKILDAELSFDEKKITFFFSADGRIDFRGLVADMVGDFHKIIRLQQVGARDEAKLYGGYGKCGRELCCAKFLTNLDSITSEMAENQEASGSKSCFASSKMAGCCGKLMCCLSFEAVNQAVQQEKIK